MKSCICIPDIQTVNSLYKEKGISCTCGEASEAMSTLTCAQHSSDCAIMKALSKDKNNVS